MKQIVEKMIECNESLMLENGLYIAANGPEYQACWLRDIYYQAKPSLKLNPTQYVKTYETICEYWNNLDLNYSNKLHLLKQYGKEKFTKWETVHSKISKDANELWQEWGHKQLDSYAYNLLGIIEGWNAGLEIKGSKECMKHILEFLKAIKYWEQPDSGIWEEREELRASSIGAVVGACKALLTSTEIFEFDTEACYLYDKGMKVLKEFVNKDFARETNTRQADLSLATLIYPFNVFEADSEEGKRIIEQLKTLERPNGFIRYQTDKYFNEGSEMQWPLGFAFMAEITGCLKYKVKLLEIFNDNKIGIPEGYIPHEYGFIVNPNSNLGWATAMCIELFNK